MRKKSCLQFNHVDDKVNTKSDIELLKLWYSHYHRSMSPQETVGPGLRLIRCCSSRCDQFQDACKMHSELLVRIKSYLRGITYSQEVLVSDMALIDEMIARKMPNVKQKYKNRCDRITLMYMKKERLRRLLRLIVSCCRLTSETVEVVHDDPWRMDLVEEYVNIADIAMDSWQCPDTAWVESPVLQMKRYA